MAYQKETTALPAFFLVCAVSLIAALLMGSGEGILISLIGFGIAALRGYQMQQEHNKHHDNIEETYVIPHVPQLDLDHRTLDTPVKVPIKEPEFNVLTEVGFKIKVQEVVQRISDEDNMSDDRKVFLTGERLLKHDPHQTISLLFKCFGMSHIAITNELIKEFQNNYLTAFMRYIPGVKFYK